MLLLRLRLLLLPLLLLRLRLRLPLLLRLRQPLLLPLLRLLLLHRLRPLRPLLPQLLLQSIPGVRSSAIFVIVTAAVATPPPVHPYGRLRLTTTCYRCNCNPREVKLGNFRALTSLKHKQVHFLEYTQNINDPRRTSALRWLLFPSLQDQEPPLSSLLCPACCLEIREKALDRLLYRLTRLFHRCNFDRRLGRLAGFHLWNILHPRTPPFESLE